MSVINTNVKSLMAQNAMTINNRAMTHAMQQLSTGRRISSAADDAAGLAMSETMTAQIRGLDMAVRNANDAVSLMQTAEGAMIEQTNMIQRMRELSVQAASDTVSSTEKTYINTEYQQLMKEIDRIGANTEWNGDTILTGAGGQYSSTSGEYTFQVGGNAGSGQTITVIVNNMSTGSTGEFSALSSTSLTAATASSLITTLDACLDSLASQRATIGAAINRLNFAADNLSNISQNVSESRSRIVDADYAKISSELARTQIIAQAATAMLAQANQQPQMVLKLLQ